MTSGTQLLGLSQFGNFNSPQAILQQISRPGNGVFRNGNGKNLRQTSNLSIQERALTNISAQTNIQSQIQSSLLRSISQVGNTLNIQTQQNIQGTTSSQSRQELTQVNKKQVEGQVNGRPVFSNIETSLRQVSTAARNTSFNENRLANQAISRNVERNGNTVQVNTHIDTGSQGNLAVQSNANRVTDTERQVQAYDRNGNLIGDRTSRQIVAVEQQSSLLQTRQGEGTRDIQQTTTATANKEGNALVRNIKSEVTDTSQGHQEINTAVQTRTNTQVDNLDVEGNIISSRSGSQLVSSNEARTIDAARQTQGESLTHVAANPQQTEVISRNRFETNATTLDQTKTTGTVQNFNGEGVLVNEREFQRNVTAVTTENREGENNARTTIARENGGVAVHTAVNSRENAEVNTQIAAEQGGAVTERTINAQGTLHTRGELDNSVDAEGNRVVTFEAERVSKSKTSDLIEGPNGQGRLVETETKAAQLVQGQLQFNPDTNKVEGRQNAAPGGVTVDIGTNTGLRASFRLDNGVLTFDFTVQKAAVTTQETATGQVVSQGNVNTAVAGNEVGERQGVGENIHFQGRVVSSVDEAGNRVLSIEGSAVNEGYGARVVEANGQQNGYQVESRKSELEFSGKLAVNRQTETDGTTTTTNTKTSAELNVNRVDNVEAAGVNVRTLTPLTSTNGLRAGFVANNGSLRFNLGTFNFGISLVA